MENAHLQALQTLERIRLNARRYIEPLLRQEGLGIVQAMLLAGVANGEIENIGGVCQTMEMGQGNASTLCKRMEQDGLLLRERSKEDERVVRLSLTDRGASTLERVAETLDRYWDQAAQAYPELEARILDGLEAVDQMLLAVKL